MRGSSRRDALGAYLTPRIAAMRQRAGDNVFRIVLRTVDKDGSIAPVSVSFVSELRAGLMKRAYPPQVTSTECTDSSSSRSLAYSHSSSPSSSSTLELISGISLSTRIGTANVANHLPPVVSMSSSMVQSGHAIGKRRSSSFART